MEKYYLKMKYLLAMLVVQSHLFFLAHSLSNITDQTALFAIKAEMKLDPNNILSTNWTNVDTTNFCNWFGVSCSLRRQRVTALTLPGMGLQGTISPYVGNLSFLVTLDLQNNSFRGPLTHEIGRLGRLKELLLQLNNMEGTIPQTLTHCRKLESLYLTGNGFGGVIPEDLGTLPNLHTLSLGKNRFMGSIPSSLGNISTLQTLGLGHNAITGSIPSTIFNISSLRTISLTNNSISGNLPMDICVLCPKLEGLYLSENQFGGQIPSTIAQCTELVVLSLSYNSFEGSIRGDIGSLDKLERLYLGGNKFAAGTIPPSLGNISSLLELGIETSSLHGEIPAELTKLSKLRELLLGENHLTGIIPPQIFNISSLEIIELVINSLEGNLPETTGLWLPNLEELFLDNNRLGGNIPSHLSNSSKLQFLSLNLNLFTGSIPASLGNLQLLEELTVDSNQLTDTGSPELGFITALTKCKSLQTLTIASNAIEGVLPRSIGNLSSSLKAFNAYGCRIKGSIPQEIGSLKHLNLFILSNNNVNGSIPPTIGGLESLQRLYLDGNKIEGLVPEELCHLKQLGELYLYSNELSGPIPTCIGNLTHLQKLFLNSNNLSSSIPTSLWTLENLLFLNLSTNSLSGNLHSKLRMSKVIQSVDLSRNHIEGNIPQTFNSFQTLGYLNLSRNSLQGPIPESLGYLIALESMDLSYNNLSGTIPRSFEKLSALKYLNLSFNELSGEIPNGGPFSNFTVQSFMGNDALCGKPILQVPTCPTHNSKKTRTKQKILKYVLIAIALSVFSISFTYMLIKCQKRRVTSPRVVETEAMMEHKMISYHELCQATNNFCDESLVGIGSYGSVYRGVLLDGTIVGIKILNLELEGAFRSFDAECEVLRNVRHRNLVKIISTCSNPELRALILQYMSNGSLEKWIHSPNYTLDFLHRVGIMHDVALAMEYLHHGQSEPVIHCDLKPSNVLLDEEMVAHVADFGIAKILAENKTALQTKTLGTFGYIAPEYGSEGRVSAECDVYSYGIMLLETFTRRRPSDDFFSGDLSLTRWVRAALPDKVMEVMDRDLLETNEGNNVFDAQHCFLAVMEIGIKCSSELPEERGTIKDVVVKLSKIKSQLLC